jgi:DNA-binding winged helix-turn-helix (wHTH) protein
MTFQFASFTLDVARRQLLRDDEEVHLSPKAFLLLQHLVEARPNAIAKRDLHDRLWPDTFVVESNLAALINEVRRALKDDARKPLFIRTVHGYGYAFGGSAVESTPRASRANGPLAARLGWSGGEWPLYVGRNVIGRDAECDVHVDDRTVSRQHAAITITAVNATLEDLGSKNGTFIDGRRITSPARVTDGTEVTIGSVKLQFRTASDSSTMTLHR